MTDSHRSEMLASIPDLRRRIRDGGLRATPCRIAVLGLMQNQDSPLCHSDTVEQLADRSFDQSTVYRALNDLADVGLLKRMELGDHVWRFELPEQNGTRVSHPHHLCEACGKIACLPDVTISCEGCGGNRFDQETLSVRVHGQSVAEVLEMDTKEAAEFFVSHPRIGPTLNLLVEVGLGYLKLGQPSPTLSGGEAQRIKIVAELARRAPVPVSYTHLTLPTKA